MSVQTWIEGERDEGVARQVEEAAVVLQDAELDAQLDQERVLIDLLNTDDQEQFMDQYQRNLHVRSGLDWNEYRANPGQSLSQRLVALMRGGLLRLLRPAMEWLTYRQSAVNSQLTSLLMDERKSRIATDRRLQEEMDALRIALQRQTQSPDGKK